MQHIFKTNQSILLQILKHKDGKSNGAGKKRKNIKKKKEKKLKLI